MDDNGDDPLTGDQYQSELDSQSDQESPAFTSNLFLDHVGKVILTHNSDELSWELAESIDTAKSNCLGIELFPKVPSRIKFSDVYAAESINYGLIHESNIPKARIHLLNREAHGGEMHRFAVHSFQRSRSQPCLWVLSVYTFGHKDLQTCQMWVNRINTSLNRELGRPKNLLVLIHPRSGKGNGCIIWESIAPIFLRAKVKTKVVVTERAGHAFDVMASTTTKELRSYDGVVAVGGDGFFNEILNGLLLSRHKAPYPPAPADFVQSVCNPVEIHADNSSRPEDESPLLSENGDGVCSTDQDPEFSLSNGLFRLGLIPSGSTDAIVICTTGTRDPTTSALHIVLGKRVCLDIAHIVRWKETLTSQIEPFVRYAASFAGYGFYGDVITESEKLRWMGPKRYDYSGTKVFFKHRSYEAEVSYLEYESEKSSTIRGKGRLGSKLQALWGPKSEKLICRVNCTVCNTKPVHVSNRDCYIPPNTHPQETKWSKTRGRFLSIGAAVISNRNERAPDGLVADAHLSDGFLHLILIKDCSHSLYLWHLTQLAMKGGNPLNFEFVEHHKTSAFTFTSAGKESVWNVDGELFKAHKLSAQVFRGLVSLFASGPEV